MYQQADETSHNATSTTTSSIFTAVRDICTVLPTWAFASLCMYIQTTDRAY